MKNKVNPKFKYLIPLFLIGFLLIPQPAFAFIEAMFQFLDHLTESIEESQFAMFQLVFNAFLFYLVGVGSLVITSWFLQFCLENQTIWLTSLNIMTEVGWNFTAGLANMFVVLILLIIAFAFILKIETFQAQKALPRLIIIALLLNFSWFFVKMLIDLTQIIYATILAAGGENLLGTTLAPFFGGIKDVVAEALVWLGALIGSLMVPIASTWSSLIFAGLFLGIFLPNILIWIFKTFCFFTISGVFLTFALLFAARVFVLQMLAILSPIAFLALILPQTRSQWEDWLKNLTSWLLLGVFLLFFLVIGFKGLGYIIPEGLFGFWTSLVPIPGLALFELGKYIFYYFAIFTYMVVLIFISKKYLPELASFLIGTATAAAGFVMARGLKPLGKMAKIHGAQVLTGGKPGSRMQKMQERFERWATAKPPEKGEKWFRSRRLLWASARGIGKKLSTDVQEFQLQRIHEAEQKWQTRSAAAQNAALATAAPDVKTGIMRGTLKAENFEDIVGSRAEANPDGELAKAKGNWEKRREEYKKGEKEIEEFTKADKEAEEKENEVNRLKEEAGKKTREAENKSKEAKDKEGEGKTKEAVQLRNEAEKLIQEAERLKEAAWELGGTATTLRQDAEKFRGAAEKALEKRETRKQELSGAEKKYLGAIEKEFDLKNIYELSHRLKERGILRAAFPSVAKEVHQTSMSNIVSAIKPEQFSVIPMTTIALDREFNETILQEAKSSHIEAYAHRFRISGQKYLQETLMDLAVKERKTASEYLAEKNPEIHDYLKSWFGLRFIDLGTLDDKVNRILKLVSEKPEERK